jgi:hypothetical protein
MMVGYSIIVQIIIEDFLHHGNPPKNKIKNLVAKYKKGDFSEKCAKSRHI